LTPVIPIEDSPQQEAGPSLNFRPTSEEQPGTASDAHIANQQQAGSVGYANQDDNDYPEALTTFEGLWEFDESKEHQGVVCDNDRMFLVIGYRVLTPKGIGQQMIINETSTKFAVSGEDFEVDASDQSLRCQLPCGSFRYYQRALLPHPTRTARFHGSWRAMSNRNEKVPWKCITVRGLVWKGYGSRDCGGFLRLRRGDGAVMVGTDILSETEDGYLLMTTASGDSVRFFRVRGNGRLDPVEE